MKNIVFNIRCIRIKSRIADYGAGNVSFLLDENSIMCVDDPFCLVIPECTMVIYLMLLFSKSKVSGSMVLVIVMFLFL